MSIYQSKVNLDENIEFGNIPHLTDTEIRKMLAKDMFGNKNSTFHSGPNLPSIEIRIQRLKIGNVNFDAT